jgi:hypothetical protein
MQIFSPQNENELSIARIRREYIFDEMVGEKANSKLNNPSSIEGSF